MKTPELAKVLPQRAREALAKAARVENTPTDPNRRTKAIERATRNAQLFNPHLYK